MILSLLAFVLLSSSLGALGRSLNNSDSCRQLLESKFPHLCDRLGDLEPLGWACEQLTLWQSRLVPEVPLSLRQSDW